MRACCHDWGFEAVQRVYLDVLEGRVDPKTANVLLDVLLTGEESRARLALDELADHIAAVT